MHFRCLLFVILAFLGSVHASETRVALVIGNSAYERQPLRNPVNDAQAMAARLRTLGFVVIERNNLRIRQIGSTLREFRSQLKPGAVALVFYAGHGLQVKGENYLPAVDAQIDGEEDVPNQSLAVRQIMDVLAESTSRLNLVFLDACRNNPYVSGFRSVGQGLSREAVPSGTLMSFATRPGGVADDGPGQNGLYTTALLQAMAEVNQPIERVLKNVVSRVRALSNNRQEPWMEGSITGEFCFGSCMQTGHMSQTITDAEREEKFWDDTKAIGNREAYEAYLAVYPLGRYASLSKAAIGRLSSLPPAATPAIPSPTGSASTSLIAASQQEPSTSQLLPPGSVFKDCDLCPEMVVIPEGQFEMGAASEEDKSEGMSERSRNRSEPRRWVTINTFAAGRFEVTRAQYQKFAEQTGRNANSCWHWNGRAWVQHTNKSWRDPGYTQDERHPVACVSWEDARAYVDWLSQLTGKHYRLLTEAEWEYVARAGTTTRRYWGDDGDNSCEFSNVADRRAQSQVPEAINWRVAQCDDGHAWTAPVGHYRANAFGVYDILGNVWEWVVDCWNGNYVGAPTNGQAWTTGDCSQRVLRGGSWNTTPGHARSAFRIRLATTNRLGIDFGFRVARTD